jgi:NSS family neurotransmitter:Na+ symporter
MSILDVMDFVSNNLLMPLVGLLTCLFVGYWIGPRFVKDEIEATPSTRFKGEKLFRIMIRYVAPVFLLVILVSSVLNALGFITL